MSEPEYTEAWGVRSGDRWDTIHDTEHEANVEVTYYPSDGDGDLAVIQLIPQPEVDRLIAEAVAAERERCRRIAEHQWRVAVPLSARSDTVDMWASRTTAECIGMAIESGIEPGEGGAP